MADYDAIVVGGGHNGLTAAAYLARAGRKVALFEARESLGGVASTEELFPGFRFNTGLQSAALLPELVSDLGLGRHGLEFVESVVRAFAPGEDDKTLSLWADAQRAADEIRPLSERDAAAYPQFVQQLSAFAGVLEAMARLAPPSLQYAPPALLLNWARAALKVRRLGGKQMMEFLRVLPMGAQRYLDEWFESDVLKGMLGVQAIDGLMQGPRAAGTTFMLLYQQLFGGARMVRVGVGAVSAALASAAEGFGAEVHKGRAVKRILVRDDRAVGVELADGSQLTARAVLSSAEPRRTFLDLVGAPQLEPRFVRRLRAFKLRGGTASVHLALNGVPEFAGAEGELERLSGDIVICPHLDYAERAYDDAKYGRISRQPVLIARIPSLLDASLAPEGQQAMSVIVRYAPYHLREGDWEGQRERLGDLAVSTLETYAPGLNKLVLDRKVITPQDYEREYGLTEGSLTHGQMGLDQLLLMRPVPGFRGYHSPVERLYLCGAGAHPGGGLTGAPGRNAARQVLQES